MADGGRGEERATSRMACRQRLRQCAQGACTLASVLPGYLEGPAGILQIRDARVNAPCGVWLFVPFDGEQRPRESLFRLIRGLPRERDAGTCFPRQAE